MGVGLKNTVQGQVSHQVGLWLLSPQSFSDLGKEEVAHSVSRPRPTVLPLRSAPHLSTPLISLPILSQPQLFSLPLSLPPPLLLLKPCTLSQVPGSLPAGHPPSQRSPVHAGVPASVVLDACWGRWDSGSLSASSAMTAPLSQPGTGTERPAGPGCTGPGGAAKVEAEGRDTGWHLPLSAARAAPWSWSPRRGGQGAGLPDTAANHPRAGSSHFVVCALSFPPPPPPPPNQPSATWSGLGAGTCSTLARATSASSLPGQTPARRQGNEG